jgi:hypothetical protein
MEKITTTDPQKETSACSQFHHLIDLRIELMIKWLCTSCQGIKLTLLPAAPLAHEKRD